MRWVEFGGEIWPVPDDVAVALGLGQAGSPGAPGWIGPVSEVNLPPTLPPTAVRPVRPRWEKRYVCDWRWVRIPPLEPPPRTTFGIKPTGGALGPPVGIEGLFYD